MQLYQKHQGAILTLELCSLIPIFMLLIFVMLEISVYSSTAIKIDLITANTARYASLESTTSTTAIQAYANQLITQYNLDPNLTEVTIIAPQGLTTTGSNITIEIDNEYINHFGDANLITNIIPNINRKITIRKEGVL